jgi:hypothetical protein
MKFSTDIPPVSISPVLFSSKGIALITKASIMQLVQETFAKNAFPISLPHIVEQSKVIWTPKPYYLTVMPCCHVIGPLNFSSQ